MEDSEALILTPLVLQAGLTILAAHCSLYVIFAYVLPKGPWSVLPSFTAHQVVCLPLMIRFTYIGFRFWFFNESNSPLDQKERILGEYQDGVNLGQEVLGAMIFWDIPIGLITPALCDPLMFAHHVGLACMSGVVVGVFSGGKPVGSYYGTFFFGVIEVSSIFLTLVDVFHPKHKAWFKYLHEEGPAFLLSLNEMCRVLFALSYLAVRAIYFPYVIFTGATPDFYHVAILPEDEREGVHPGVLYFVIVFAVLFSGLQMYWGILVSRQVAKALGFGSKADKKTKTS